MRFIQFAAFAISSILISHTSTGHCQVPCGIYGDELKFKELVQHSITIKKASQQIRDISAQDTLSAQDRQQLIRWTIQKEAHAQQIIDEVADYFLAQRIKPEAENYQKKLEALHHIIFYSMKSKQSVKKEPVALLGNKITKFEDLYFGLTEDVHSKKDHGAHGHSH